MLEEKHRKSLLLVFDKSRLTVDALKTTLRDTPGPWDMTICAGVGTLLGDIYMSVENILRLFIEGVYGEKIIKDEAWHRRLIDAGIARGLLPEDVEASVPEMRRFRHRLMHGYGIDMDEDKLREGIPRAIFAYTKIEEYVRAKFPELDQADDS